MRGFGTIFELQTGRVRSWYSGPDGIKKWADTGEIVPDERGPHGLGDDSAGDAE